jgi:hypothetical protein
VVPDGLICFGGNRVYLDAGLYNGLDEALDKRIR